MPKFQTGSSSGMPCIYLIPSGLCNSLSSILPTSPIALALLTDAKDFPLCSPVTLLEVLLWPQGCVLPACSDEFPALPSTSTHTGAGGQILPFPSFEAWSTQSFSRGFRGTEPLLTHLHPLSGLLPFSSHFLLTRQRT